MKENQRNLKYQHLFNGLNTLLCNDQFERNDEIAKTHLARCPIWSENLENIKFLRNDIKFDHTVGTSKSVSLWNNRKTQIYCKTRELLSFYLFISKYKISITFNFLLAIICKVHLTLKHFCFESYLLINISTFSVESDGAHHTCLGKHSRKLCAPSCYKIEIQYDFYFCENVDKNYYRTILRI
ncbi:uncharacterized protein [Prorops nasuta]|uniref:uncharacterized protein n=1 Tax=Prorops nasuta TaxID=863751 RepID=UPI0034CFC987